MKRALLLLVLAGCSEDGAECPSITECGDAPLAPGISASFDNGTATMSRAAYDGIIAYHDEVAMWRACVAGL